MFTDCYCTQFRCASNALTRIYDEALRPVGLRITQFSLLRALSRLGEATVTQLSIEAALDLTTISRNVKLLVESGWVDVLPSGREKVLKLNTLGKNAIQNATPHWAEAQSRVEAYMKKFLKTPTNARLLRALEALQQAADR
jgi:DNA-binding MarR family transcriptional regulator